MTHHWKAQKVNIYSHLIWRVTRTARIAMG